jgi:hypothetical protein
LHRFVEPQQLRTPGFHKLLEQQAFRFGSAFLMPSSWLKELWAPTLDAFLALKARWKVSIAAMISRSEDLGVVNADQAQRLWINYNRRQWRKSEPLDDKLIPEEPRIIKRCLELLLEDRTKTRDQILLDLNLNSRDVEQLAGLPSGFLSNNHGDVFVMTRSRSRASGKRSRRGCRSVWSSTQTVVQNRAVIRCPTLRALTRLVAGVLRALRRSLPIFTTLTEFGTTTSCHSINASDKPTCKSTT